MTLSPEILKQFKKDKTIFIETGTYLGRGVSCALRAGFSDISSIEFYEDRYKHCLKLYKDNPKVSLFQGNSGLVLGDILKNLNEPAVFWLDSHYDASGSESEHPVPLTDTQPILKELDSIQQHHITNHTILIDDRRIFSGEFSAWNNIKEEDILTKLNEINSSYSISFVDSTEFKKDIIVAEFLGK